MTLSITLNINNTRWHQYDDKVNKNKKKKKKKKNRNRKFSNPIKFKI